MTFPLIERNGADFVPNTSTFHASVGKSFEEYADSIAQDPSKKSVSGGPVVICIPKGTPMPEPLILFHEYDTHFSLQPPKPVSLPAIPAGLWLASHLYREAVKIEEEEEWILMWTLRRVGRNRKMFPSSYAYYKAKTRCYEVLLAFDSIYEVKVTTIFHHIMEFASLIRQTTSLY
ncbi:hypothetical protein T310_3478 [Rasamsonia emersonii CBS 393.64]|uniref:Tse2 ADP-ribosyltransferase toxin domain-containing protein n=1 Tax=Rasamsonia emersonii (strain ATCC 16479 / CBS 393.64 / IMI 116815) TaxID=1408163 RepID=A0A0F4YWK2_RASE3|nr:hypothetical protein T310_3478 [Rasamsonia emersonii CBS 393.64]KKA22480.1 hypothetical protein T310_3478 [Rasamsonia emersonii CBS 393.64]